MARHCRFLPYIGKATIIFIFWDSLMFYQIFLSPQVKRCGIISYKHGIYTEYGYACVSYQHPIFAHQPHPPCGIQQTAPTRPPTPSRPRTQSNIQDEALCENSQRLTLDARCPTESWIRPWTWNVKVKNFDF